MASQSKEKVTTTPLIQYLKEKKANKGKDAAATTAKGTKHTKQTSKDTPSSSASASDKTSPAKTAPPTGQMPDKRSPQAIMVEKAARDAARIGNKQASTANKPQSPSPAPASPVTAPTSTGSSPLAEKKRERGSASAAASILRRDLGIGASPGARGGRRGLSVGQGRPNTNTSAQGAPAVPVQVENAKPTTNPAPTASSPPTNTVNRTVTAASTTNSSPAPPAPGPQPPTGPAASRMPPKAPASNAAPTPPKPSPTSSTATQAFLKHANPSQGITEPLLEEAFAAFGTVRRVEIDRKKGSAYVDFEDPEGLQKAIKASPVKVAQGQVVVLERRIGPNPQARNVRGGPMMNSPRAINARGGMVNQRGGMVNNRGGGIPIGPMGARGGAVRGRGGFVRGRGNMPNAVNNRPAASTTHQSAQENTSSTTVTTARNGSTPPPSEPPKEAANPSASTPPATDESAT